MTQRHTLLKLLKAYSLITFGALIYALSFNWFFQPNHIAFGGLTGIAQILNRIWPVLPVGAMVIVMNVPLFVAGVRRMGVGLLLSSLYCMAVSSIFVDIMAAVHTFSPMDPLLASLYGGLTLGFSLGLVLMANATSGGTELLARLLKYHLPNLSMGRLCLAIDLVVIVAYAAAFRSLNNALYGIVALYIATIVMDMVIYGSQRAVLAYIISDHSGTIAAALLELDMGITLLNGTGGFSGGEKRVILCAIRRRQVAVVKELVNERDPAAFVIVCQAHEVLGEGFTAYDKNAM
jgi:uncharacterized membrane-anchored protein YitT (DUF2179 family)